MANNEVILKIDERRKSVFQVCQAKEMEVESYLRKNWTYQINAVEMYILGLSDGFRKSNDDDPLDFKQFCRQLSDRYDNADDPEWLQIILALEYGEILRATKGSILPPAIQEGWDLGKLATNDKNISEGMGIPLREESVEEGDYLIEIASEDRTKEEVEYTRILPMDITRHLWLELSNEQWANLFDYVSWLRDDENKNVYCLPSSYMVWAKWDKDGPQFVNPCYIPRNKYFGMVQILERNELWGNMLINLLLNGLTRNSFGHLFRQSSTNLITPIQVYGNKSEYNKVVEVNKPGFVDITLSTSGNGIRINFENETDLMITAVAYKTFNSAGIPCFPQHQGEDLRIMDAATASLVSLVKMGDIPIYIFARSVDKVTKLFNRLSLLNRVGTEGVCTCDPDDM
jgi:hypothetical protein